jgi:hypothetical protein
MTRQPIMPADIRALHERLSEIAVLPIFYRTI